MVHSRYCINYLFTVIFFSRSMTSKVKNNYIRINVCFKSTFNTIFPLYTDYKIKSKLLGLFYIILKL